MISWAYYSREYARRQIATIHRQVSPGTVSVYARSLWILLIQGQNSLFGTLIVWKVSVAVNLDDKPKITVGAQFRWCIWRVSQVTRNCHTRTPYAAVGE